MTITETTDEAPPRKHGVSLRKHNAKHQKAWRDRRKAKFAEALAMLEKLGDDDPIVITGTEAE
jgi:hypothetical protein